MTPDTVISIGKDALIMTVMIAAPMLLSALLVGLLVGMFQAATQVNEMTLSFIPKLLVLVFVLFFTGPWILSSMMTFTKTLVSEVIPAAVGY